MSICETKSINVSKEWTILAVLVNLYKFENFVFSWNMDQGSVFTLEYHIPTEKFAELEKSGSQGVRNVLRHELITDADVFNHVAEVLSSCGEMYFEGEELEKMGFETEFFVVDYKVCDCSRDVLYAFDV